MNICILTHPLGANYGGILQAYALSTVLKTEGHNVTVLRRDHDMPLHKRFIKQLLIALKHPRYNSPKYKDLRLFVNQHLNESSVLYSTDNLRNYVDNNKIDAVVVGSDQVWRTDFAMGYGYNYFLDFVPAGVRKLSYAASFGLSQWEYNNEQTQRIKQLVSDFKAISVREDEGVQLCKDNIGVTADHVLDPTMLLNASDYEPVTSERKVKDDYVFVYWLGSAEEKQKAIEAASIEGKRIVDISLRGSEPLMPIEDWLSYIKYADHVVTDSFHGCVFSILLGKQFTICANDSGGNGRLRSLFSMLGIDTSSPQIDYTIVYDKLDNLRSHSYDFLNKALQ